MTSRRRGREDRKCPICGNPKAKIIWKREDGKVIGVKCPGSHGHKKGSVVLTHV